MTESTNTEFSSPSILSFLFPPFSAPQSENKQKQISWRRWSSCDELHPGVKNVRLKGGARGRVELVTEEVQEGVGLSSRRWSCSGGAQGRVGLVMEEVQEGAGSDLYRRHGRVCS